MPLRLRSIAFQRSLQCLLTHLLTVHYTAHRSVCVIRTPSEDVSIGGHTLPQVHLVLELPPSPAVHGGSERLLDDLLQQDIVTASGGFVVTDGTLFPFLDRFFDMHKGAMMQPAVKRMIAVITHLDEPLRGKLRTHEALESLVNILFVVPNVTGDTVGLHTTHIRPAVPIGTTIELVQFAELAMASDPSSARCQPFPELDYFPDKISDMGGRRLRVATIAYPPCTAWTEVPLGQGNAMDINNTTHSLQLEGLELITILEFCQRHNCKLELVLAADWGFFMEDGSTTGLLDVMVHHEADLVHGAIYEWYTWWQLLSITTPVGMSSVTCLVPRPKLLPYWQTPFLSFRPSLWVMVGVVFLSGTGAVFATELYRHRVASADHHHPVHRGLLLLDAFLLMVSLYVEQAVRLRTDLMTAVVLLTALLYGGFMIGNSYAGALASIMTVPRYEKSIDTAADFVARGMRWTGASMAWMTSLDNATDPSLIRMRETFEVFDDEARTRLSLTDDRMGYIFERFQYGNYGFGMQLDLNASSRLQSLTQILFREYTCGFTTKVWPLREAYDRLILDLQQSGIFHYLELTSVIRQFGLSVQRNIENARLHEPDGEPVQLSIDHFLGVFFILVLGLSLATVAFVAEVVVHKWHRRARW